MKYSPVSPFAGFPIDPFKIPLVGVASTRDYNVFGPRPEDNLYSLDEAANSPFGSQNLFFYDSINELPNGGTDAVFISNQPKSINRVTGETIYFDTYTLGENIENIFIYTKTPAFQSIYGNNLNNYMYGSNSDDNFFGLEGNDAFSGALGRDSFDGGPGIDFLVLDGPRSSYSAYYTQTADIYVVTSNSTPTTQFFKTIRGTEFVQFSDGAVWLETTFPFQKLVAENSAVTKAVSAAYQILLGGVPTLIGYDYLIRSNVENNFGAGPGPSFNTENIFINITNALVQGNPAASQKFNTIATGANLAEKVFSIYKSIVPQSKQTLDGVAFLTRPEGLAFYQSVAAERGIASENGAAVVALASLLKVAVDGKFGIGNAVSDLVAAIADGSASLQALSTNVTRIEVADGLLFDGDDASDVMPGFAPAPIAIVGNGGFSGDSALWW